MRAWVKGRGRPGALIAALCCALAVASSASAATPEAIRACVERNLTRYAGPADAVAAQYADLETACIAALDGSGVSVQFTPEAGGDGSTREGGSPPDTPASPASDAAPRPGPAPGQRERSTGPRDPRASEEGTPGKDASTRELVRISAAAADANAGSPLPTAVGDLPAWLMVLLAGMGLLVVGGAVAGLRKRLR